MESHGSLGLAQSFLELGDLFLLPYLLHRDAKTLPSTSGPILRREFANKLQQLIAIRPAEQRQCSEGRDALDENGIIGGGAPNFKLGSKSNTQITQLSINCVESKNIGCATSIIA